MAATTLVDTVKESGATAVSGDWAYASPHTAYPASTGNEDSATRQVVPWGTAGSGQITTTGAMNFTGGTANGAIGSIGFWSAASGGSLLGSIEAPTSSVFNAEGKIDVDSVTV